MALSHNERRCFDLDPRRASCHSDLCFEPGPTRELVIIYIAWNVIEAVRLSGLEVGVNESDAWNPSRRLI